MATAAPNKPVCVKGHEAPKLEFVLECFSLKRQDVLYACIIGSHLWNSCSKKSDWDLVIVTKDSKTLSRAVNAHRGNIDAWIVPEAEYNTYITEHLIQALLTLWIPESLVLVKSPGFNPAGKFRLSGKAMVAGVEKLYARDVRVAAKHFGKGDSAAGFKIVKHLLRQLELSRQIVESGSIVEYCVPIDCSTENDGSWSDIENMLQRKKTSVLASIP